MSIHKKQLEKLKYLLTVEFANSKFFQLESLSIESQSVDNDNPNIDNYTINLVFDYEGSIETEFESFLDDMKTMSYRLNPLLTKYTISADGKLQHDKFDNKAHNIETSIWKLDFIADDTHRFTMDALILL